MLTVLAVLAVLFLVTMLAGMVWDACGGSFFSQLWLWCYAGDVCSVIGSLITAIFSGFSGSDE